TIQSDEARHSQIGEPLLRILIEHGKQAEAQKLLDISFWRCWKQFSPLSGICMDYYTPLAHREHSFKEFMQEWVSEQFIRRILDLGLSRPWYWDIFLEDLETFHHAQQVGVYLYRPTEWWHPIAGVNPDERDWLEAHYPGWNETFGTCWDVIIDNILNGRTDATVPEPLPMICNMSGFELTGVPGKPLKDYTLDYKGRRYHFGSEVDRWIFEQDPQRYAGHRSLVDRYVGRVMPRTAEDVLTYMGMSAPERGTDGTNFAWVEPYRRARGKAA
ncbi:MAG: YHS domain-containing protein, partial [Deltaproteobacteria bacterium]|nr:YHS domain-containing protein [Deltaproteobacteria bacterium]